MLLPAAMGEMQEDEWDTSNPSMDAVFRSPECDPSVRTRRVPRKSAIKVKDRKACKSLVTRPVAAHLEGLYLHQISRNGEHTCAQHC